MKPTVSVIITTRNRKEDLQRTLEVLSHLDPQADEILITTDGCNDGTVEFLKSLPHIRLTVNNPARGSISSRDSMIRAATGDLLLSLDDDSYPVEPDFIWRACTLFENNPRLAVATFPQYSDEFPESLTQEDFGPTKFVGSYVSSSAVIRRSVFLELGGYTTQFFHAYEEPDFTLRCVAAGWQVKFETSLHVRHHYSGVQRNEMRTHHFHARNELWSAMMRCPAPWFIPVGLFRVARQFNHARKHGISWMIREPSWWMSFASGLPECLSRRSPLPWEKYLSWMKLVRTPITSEEEWTNLFGAKNPTTTLQS